MTDELASDLLKQQKKRIGNSPERALANQFDLAIIPLLQEAWEKTKHNKRPILLGALIVYLVANLGGYLLGLTPENPININGLATLSWVEMAGHLAFQIVITVLLAGLITMGLNNAVRNESAMRGKDEAAYLVPDNQITMVFQHIPQAWAIAFIQLTQYLAIFIFSLVVVGLNLMLNLPFHILLVVLVTAIIYLSLALSLAVPLVIKDNLAPIKAMHVSFLVVFRNFFTFFRLYCVVFALFLISVFTFFIGFIWTIPFFYNLKGILYREIFGIEVTVISHQ